MNSIISNARFETPAETAKRMSAFDAQSLAMITAPFRAHSKPSVSLSDADLDNERKAQDIFYPALAAFRTACIAAANLSELRRDAITDTLAYAESERPGKFQWDAAISEARRS